MRHSVAAGIGVVLFFWGGHALPAMATIPTGTIYYTDTTVSNGRVGRIHLDGTGNTDMVTGLTGPSGIALDVAGGKMYWCDNRDSLIQRANLDGSNVETVITGAPVARAGDLALDPVNARMYWIESQSNTIRSANLDGTNIQTMAYSPWALDIELDLPRGKVYWTDHGNEAIYRMNLDGTGLETFYQSPGEVFSVAIDDVSGAVYFSENDPGDRMLRVITPQGFVFTIRHFNREEPHAFHLTVDPVARKLYLADNLGNPDEIWRLSLTGSDLEMVGRPGGNPGGMALIPVPEPTTLTLLALATLTVTRRRR